MTMSYNTNIVMTTVPGVLDRRGRLLPTLVITSAALFMVTLDNLVVTTALPVIRVDLSASLSGLAWTVNAYTLAFAVLLLPGAALGDRFGRRRMFIVGLALFTVSSAAAALSSGTLELVAARAAQGAGGALVLPLTLTLLAAASPAHRRGAVLGIWGAVAGLGISLGPLVGGAIVEGGSWQWIFWVNVPIGVAVVVAARRLLTESTGPGHRLDLPGLALVGAALLLVVLGVLRGSEEGWARTETVLEFVAGAALLLTFLFWQTRAPAPMLPLELFRDRTFAAANALSFLLTFGLFGSVFLISQYQQIVQGNGPWSAGLHTVAWTGMPLIVAPIAGALSDRIGGRVLFVVGLGLLAAGLAWQAAIYTTTTQFSAMLAPFVVSGIGMSLFFAPIGNVVLSSVPPARQGIASGVNNAVRELGGVFGVAVLAAVFSARGGYATPTTFVAGLTAALWIAASTVAVGAGIALLIRRTRTEIPPSLPTPIPAEVAAP